jgi:hypothetical protein
MAKALLAFRKKYFSRSQIVIRSINIACEASDASLEETIMAFEEVYQVRAKLSMANMATVVQELGLVTEKKTEAKRGNLTRHAHSS